MVIDFIKSLFFPTKMVRFRYMSVIFAIGIFVLSSYLLMVPAKVDIENNFGEMVQEDNFLYLQAVTEIPTADEKIKEVFEEIHNKGLSVDSETRALVGTKMGCLTAQKNDSVLGILELTSEGNWKYNGTDTKILNSSPVNVKPVITIVENTIYVNDVNTGVAVEGVTGEVEVISLSLTKKGAFIINDQTTGIYSTKDFVNVLIDENGYVVLNGKTTSLKTEKDNVVVYFTPRSDVNYYENTIAYQNDEGVKVNLKLVIDLFDDNDNPYYDVYENFTFKDGDDQAGGRFEYIMNSEYHLIVLRKDYVYYQANPFDIANLEIERYGTTVTTGNVSSHYTTVDVDSSMFDGIEKSSETLSEIIRVGYIANYNSVYSFITLIYCVGFTVLFAFIFWLFFRKTGRLKRFKEYYNIASIVAIPVTIICFIILWFYPSGIGTVYPFTFVVWYLFILYRINSLPEIV